MWNYENHGENNVGWTVIMLIYINSVRALEFWIDPGGSGKTAVAVSREYSKEISVPYNGDSFCNVLSTTSFNKDYAICT
jgi:hypothetical protein